MINIASLTRKTSKSSTRSKYNGMKEKWFYNFHLNYIFNAFNILHSKKRYITYQEFYHKLSFLSVSYHMRRIRNFVFAAYEAIH